MTAPITSRLQSIKEEIIGRYDNGDSLDSLAFQYSANPSTIRRFLLSCDITLRPSVRPHTLGKHRDEVISLYQSGWNTRELAGKYSVDRNTVSNFLSKHRVLRKAHLSKRTFYLINDIDRGLFAGFLMGEGTISIRGKSAILTITNQDTAIIGWLAGFGGKTYWYGPRNRNPNPCGTWRLSGSVDVFHCLISIYPLLLGNKKRLATAALNVLSANYGMRATEAL